MTIWLMRMPCWIPKATYTQSEYVIIIDFVLQQRLQESGGHGIVQCSPTFTSIQDLFQPNSCKHQWLLLQFIVLLMMDAKGVRNM